MRARVSVLLGTFVLLAVVGGVPASADSADLQVDAACDPVSGAASVLVESDVALASVTTVVGGDVTTIEFRPRPQVMDYTFEIEPGSAGVELWAKTGDEPGEDLGTLVLTVATGTAERDYVHYLASGELFCGGGERDYVRDVRGGTFYGGNGGDWVKDLSQYSGVGGVFFGEEGNDRVRDSMHSNSVFYGGPGNDYVNDGMFAGAVFYGGSGDDGIDAWHYVSNPPAVFYGGPGNDRGGEVIGTFYGGSGDDYASRVYPTGIFFGHSGDDTVARMLGGLFIGANGNDSVTYAMGGYGGYEGGVFDGGSQYDTVNGYVSGTCIDIELGC